MRSFYDDYELDEESAENAKCTPIYETAVWKGRHRVTGERVIVKETFFPSVESASKKQGSSQFSVATCRQSW